MANIDDLYEILGLEAGASFEAIRAAYRRLARQMHPDVAGSQAGDQFILINRAYETLIDPCRRSDYDRRFREARRWVTRQAVVTTARVGSPVFLNSFLSDVVNAFAEPEPGAGQGQRGTGAGAGQRVDVQPVRVELVLSPEVAHSGAEVRLDLPVVITCQNCRGTGLAAPFICTACRGRGKWSDNRFVQFFLAPPVRDGQVVTLDLRSAGIPIGQVNAHIRLSWL